MHRHTVFAAGKVSTLPLFLLAMTHSEPDTRTVENFLPWWQSVALLSAVTYPIAFLCTAHGSDVQMGAVYWALVYLAALIPFFSRRTTVHTLVQILFIALIGLGIALFGWLLKANPVFFVWMGMALAVDHFSVTLPYGQLIAEQITLEKEQPGASKWINPPTTQNQRMLFVYDLVTVLLIGFVGVWLYQI